ncbi:hypothetical protein EDB80DRAFT_194747 [Ilyonectria destructans]|nr:hypothetical protein EDB80DRAFT_194747 [Ilyonectria destructans]
MAALCSDEQDHQLSQSLAIAGNRRSRPIPTDQVPPALRCTTVPFRAHPRSSAAPVTETCVRLPAQLRSRTLPRFPLEVAHLPSWSVAFGSMGRRRGGRGLSYARRRARGHCWVRALCALCMGTCLAGALEVHLSSLQSPSNSPKRLHSPVFPDTQTSSIHSLAGKPPVRFNSQGHFFLLPFSGSLGGGVPHLGAAILMLLSLSRHSHCCVHRLAHTPFDTPTPTLAPTPTLCFTPTKGSRAGLR